jgi:hypothetical protein
LPNWAFEFSSPLKIGGKGACFSLIGLSKYYKIMSLNQTKKKFFNVIKVLSIVLIISAIGWEIGNIYAALTNQKISSSLNFIFWIERFALITHFLEGIIAAWCAPFKGKTPIKYGIYTFFVGTIGLLELFEDLDGDLIKKSGKDTRYI